MQRNRVRPARCLEATALSRGASRWFLQRGCAGILGGHGLEPWSFTLVSRDDSPRKEREPPRHKAVASRKMRFPEVETNVSLHGTRPWPPEPAACRI